MQKFRILGHALSLFLFLSSSCAATSYSQEKLPLKKLSFCGQNYIAWVASKDEDRTKGLMNFRPLKKHEAMLFVFEAERPLSFWMKNVPYDLDIAYFDKSKKLVSYTTMKATSPLMKDESIPAYPSKGAAMYAVEVRAGNLKGLGPRCRLSFR